MVPPRYFPNIVWIIFPAWVLYLATLAPSIFYRDSTEFVATAYALGISHPAGFPTYNLLAKGLTFLPFGSIAFKVNLFSALCACLTLFVMHRTAQRFIALVFKDAPTTWTHWVAFLSVALLAVSGPFWFQSLVAEVYTLHALLISLMIWFLLEWKLRNDLRYLFTTAFIYGLSAGNHATVAFFLPAILLIHFCWNRKRTIQNLTVCIAFFLVGLSVFAYLPVRSATEPSFDWGNPETVDGFFFQVTDRKDAQTHFSALKNKPGSGSAGVESENSLAQSVTRWTGKFYKIGRKLVLDLHKNLSWIAVPGMLIGGFLCLRASPALFAFLIIILGGNVSFFYGWGQESFFPTYIVVTLLTALALSRLTNLRQPSEASATSGRASIRWQPLILIGVLLMVFASAMGNYFKNDRSEHYSAETLTPKLFLSLPSYSLYVTGWTWFDYYYMKDVLRLRDDVTDIAVWDLLSENPPDMLTERRYPNLKLPDPKQFQFTSKEEISRYAQELFDLNAQSHPILLELNETLLDQIDFTDQLVPDRNVFIRYSPEPAKPSPEQAQRVFEEFKQILESELKQPGFSPDYNWIKHPFAFIQAFRNYFHDRQLFGQEAQTLVLMNEFLGKRGSRWQRLWIQNRIHLGKLTEAQAQFEILSRQFPEHYQTHLSAGLIALAMNKVGQAFDAFQKAAQAQPDSYRPYLEMARGMALQDDAGATENYLQQAFQRVRTLRELTAWKTARANLNLHFESQIQYP